MNIDLRRDAIEAMAGGVAVLFHGYGSTPEEWRAQIIKKEKSKKRLKTERFVFDLFFVLWV